MEDQSLGVMKVGRLSTTMIQSTRCFGGVADNYGLQLGWQQMARATQASLFETSRAITWKQPGKMWKAEWTQLILCRMSVLPSLTNSHITL